MSFNTIYIARSPASMVENPRIKAVTDIDCLPTNIVGPIFKSITTADMSIPGDVSERFWHHYEKMKWLENLGFDICIDFGSHFYETGGEVEVRGD